MFLCGADIMESDFPSDVRISVKNDDFLLVVLSNKFRLLMQKIK